MSRVGGFRPKIPLVSRAGLGVLVTVGLARFPPLRAERAPKSAHSRGLCTAVSPAQNLAQNLPPARENSRVARLAATPISANTLDVTLRPSGASPDTPSAEAFAALAETVDEDEYYRPREASRGAWPPRARNLALREEPFDTRHRLSERCRIRAQIARAAPSPNSGQRSCQPHLGGPAARKPQLSSAT